VRARICCLKCKKIKCPCKEPVQEKPPPEDAPLSSTAARQEKPPPEDAPLSSTAARQEKPPPEDAPLSSTAARQARKAVMKARQDAEKARQDAEKARKEAEQAEKETKKKYNTARNTEEDVPRHTVYDQYKKIFSSRKKQVVMIPSLSKANSKAPAEAEVSRQESKAPAEAEVSRKESKAPAKAEVSRQESKAPAEAAEVEWTGSDEEWFIPELCNPGLLVPDPRAIADDLMSGLI
jgi:hypothetical protein